MNIHEHQAKDLLRNYGAPVSSGVVIFKKEEIDLIFSSHLLEHIHKKEIDFFLYDSFRVLKTVN